MTREDHNAAPQSAATSGPGQPSTHGKVDKPVDTGEGVCATFLFELPMGHASSLYNQALSSTASTAVPSSSSTTGWSSPMALKSPEGQGGGQGQVSPGRDHSPRPEGAEGNNSSSSGSSSSSSSSSSGRGIAKSLSYGQRAHRMQEDNEETYKRQSRLCPSFSTSQQVSTALHSIA